MILLRTAAAVAIAASLVALAPRLARSDSYATPDDFQVVCVRWDDGEVIWRSELPRLGPRPVRVGNGLVALPDSGDAELEGDDEEEDGEARTEPLPSMILLDASTGREVTKETAKSPPTPSKPLAPLPVNLKTTAGWEFEFESGNTKSLVARHESEVVFSRSLESHPSSLHLHGSLAILVFNEPHRVGASTVFAYDVAKRRMAWEFAAGDHQNQVSESGFVSLALDGDQLLVGVDEWLFAVDASTGRLRWKTELRPRQQLRRYDTYWVTAGRHDDRYVVRCYEDLFVLDAETGKLLWRRDAGFLAEPWPTIVGDRAYLLERAPDNPEVEPERVEGSKCKASAIAVHLDGETPRIEFLSTRVVPEGRTIHWSLAPVAGADGDSKKGGRGRVDGEGNDSTGDVETAVVLTLFGMSGPRSFRHVLPAAHDPQTFYFRNFRFVEEVRVERGGAVIARRDAPDAY